MSDPLLARERLDRSDGPFVLALRLSAPGVRETPEHAHARGQLFGAHRGLLSVGTGRGVWLVPASDAVWVPPHQPHSLRSHGPAFDGWSVYVAEAECAALPARPCALAVSPLLRAAVARVARWSVDAAVADAGPDRGVGGAAHGGGTSDGARRDNCTKEIGTEHVGTNGIGTNGADTSSAGLIHCGINDSDTSAAATSGDLPGTALSPAQARLARVLLDEIASACAAAGGRDRLGLPMPQDPRLLRVARALAEHPQDPRDLAAWAETAHLSERSLTRRFAAETGYSLLQWRQRARLMRALERLAAGEAVTAVALELGYDSASAFTAMFRRHLGVSPTRYLRGLEHGAAG